MGIFRKMYDAIAGEFHKVVNEKCSTPEAYAMSIRRLEGAIDKFDDAKIKAKADRNIIEKKIDELKDANSAKDAKITLILSSSPDNVHLAETLQAEIIKNNETIKENQVDLAEANTVVEEMEKALKTMKDKRAEMAKGLKELERKATTTTSKNEASKAIKDAMNSYGDAGSIDSIKGKIDRKAEEANVRFAEATSSVKVTSNTEDEIVQIEAKAAIEARLKALQSPTA